jgi:hypothetical protein
MIESKLFSQSILFLYPYYEAAVTEEVHDAPQLGRRVSCLNSWMLLRWLRISWLEYYVTHCLDHVQIFWNFSYNIKVS